MGDDIAKEKMKAVGATCPEKMKACSDGETNSDGWEGPPREYGYPVNNRQHHNLPPGGATHPPQLHRRGQSSDSELFHSLNSRNSSNQSS